MGSRIAVLLLAAGVFGGCSTPTEPVVETEMVWVSQLDRSGNQLYVYEAGGPSIVVTSEQVRSGSYSELFLRPLGSWIPRDSWLAQVRPQDIDISDPYRDTTKPRHQ